MHSARSTRVRSRTTHDEPSRPSPASPRPGTRSIRPKTHWTKTGTPVGCGPLLCGRDRVLSSAQRRTWRQGRHWPVLSRAPSRVRVRARPGALSRPWPSWPKRRSSWTRPRPFARTASSGAGQPPAATLWPTTSTRPSTWTHPLRFLPHLGGLGDGTGESPLRKRLTRARKRKPMAVAGQGRSGSGVRASFRVRMRTVDERRTVAGSRGVGCGCVGTVVGESRLGRG